MNWEAIGAVGEAVGAAGVIISLLYLAAQIRGDARAKRMATAYEQSITSREVMLSIANNADLAELFLRGINDFTSLSGAEVPRFSSLLGQICRQFENQFLQYSEGQLEHRVWRGLEASVADIFAFRGTQAWWKTRSHWFGDEFQALIAEKTASGKAPTMYGQATA